MDFFLFNLRWQPDQVEGRDIDDLLHYANRYVSWTKRVKQANPGG